MPDTPQTPVDDEAIEAALEWWSSDEAVPDQHPLQYFIVGWRAAMAEVRSYVTHPAHRK